MIEFVICDDNKEFIVMIRNKIINYMKNYPNIESTIHSFSGYGRKFEEIVASPNTFKVYFLDIETKKGSGLDAARMIREKYEDWNSLIVIITAHEELKYEALGNRLYLLDFINKFNNLDNMVEEDLNKMMKTYNASSNSIVIEFDHQIHNIELRDIVYIEKELDSKKCKISTLYGNRYVQSSLNDLYDKLDSDFMKVSRSMIVNLKRIKSYDSKSNNITFTNNEESNLVSRECKKELRERVRNNS